jgi:hypothetical protein
MQGGCNVCECDENEIPLPWKVPATDKVSSLRSNQFSQRWEEEDGEEAKVRLPTTRAHLCGKRVLIHQHSLTHARTHARTHTTHTHTHTTTTQRSGTLSFCRGSGAIRWKKSTCPTSTS